MKVTEDALDFLAEEAFLDPNTPDNPRAADAAAMRKILVGALHGSLEGLSNNGSALTYAGPAGGPPYVNALSSDFHYRLIRGISAP